MEHTFKSFEHQGWNERASAYDAYTGRFTKYGIDPLLDAAGISPAQTVLDVCCGTGLVAQAADGRGARVTGIDISEDMIAIANAKGLATRFRLGTQRPFPSKTTRSIGSSAISGSITFPTRTAPLSRLRAC